MTSPGTGEAGRGPRGWSRAGFWACAVGLAAVVLLLTVALVRDPASAPAPLVGRAAPAFTLPAVDGSARVSSGRFRGHPMVINFWASWCAPCRAEFALLRDARDRHADQGLVIVGVLFQDSRERGRDFLRETGATWPNGVDGEARTALAYGVRGLPQTVFVGADGRVTGVVFGELTSGELQRRLKPLVGGTR